MLSSRVSYARGFVRKEFLVLFTNIKLRIYSEETITGKGKITVGEGKDLLFSYQLIMG